MKCRFCQAPLEFVFIDLGNSPASNSFLTASQLNEAEVFYPLKVFVCNKCFLVQLDEFKKSESIFSDDYVYFSSFSNSWLQHASDYTSMMIERFNFNSESLVAEVASNDGYLLQYFKRAGIPTLGIEPTENTANAAREKGINTIIRFFGEKLANELVNEGRKANLIVGNNVLAHVPDIVDFVKGLKLYLEDNGVITIEFPHLMQLVKFNQFDTIYHEHFSYLSLFIVKEIFESQGLEIFDVDEIVTHGGSLRIFAKHNSDKTKIIKPSVGELLAKELSSKLTTVEGYENFQQRAFDVKIQLIEFLIEQKKLSKSVVAYGAAAKGNTLLNYCGVKNDFIEYVVDANPHKQGKYLPASHIPVYDESYLKNTKPDFIIILPWNLEKEITEQLNYVKDWGAKFIIPIPYLKVI